MFSCACVSDSDLFVWRISARNKFLYDAQREVPGTAKTNYVLRTVAAQTPCAHVVIIGVLVLWTMLLAMYTWYMMRNLSKFSYVPPPPVPSTLGVSHEPEVTEEPMSLESRVTWTLKRVLQRLERAQRRGNQGNTMRYNEMRIWLQSCISHLHEATAEDRSKMWNALIRWFTIIQSWER